MSLPTKARKTALARQAQDYPLVVRQELTALETSFGGRPTLVHLLSLAPLTTDTRLLLGVLADPKSDACSLATLCARAGILPGDLLRLLGAAALHRGQTLARHKIGEHLAAVTADLMTKAQPYEEACSGCLGVGTITPDPTPEQPNPSPGPCDTCKGSGRLRYQPTFERQKLALEMGGLLPKAGGISITQQNLQVASAGASSGGALEQLQLATDKLLYGEGAPTGPVEGELLDPPEAEAPAP